ncbi:DoxX family membrane protein [Streptomyces sp. NPDC005786]|uniref:DoxX family protein n=1 Tax=unclassified Streptomyces TaxID=2593676 RepID=UPI0033F5513B
MAILRTAARPLLASAFVSGGLRALRAPHAAAPDAAWLALPVADRLPGLSRDPARLVRMNSAVQIGAGALLATGRFPRSSALVLAATLVPTALWEHAWWRAEDQDERARRRVRFASDMSLLGGLLIAAADTHGKPSLAYRTRGAAAGGRRGARRAAREVSGAVAGAADSLHAATASVRDRLPHA